MLVEIDHGRLRVGTKLAGSGTQSIGGLQWMSTLDRLAAARTDAEVNGELPHDGLAGNLGLVLVIDMGFVDVTATLRTGIGQRGVQFFVDLGRGRRRSMAMLAVLAAALAARRLGMLLGRGLGKGSRLALGGTLEGLDLPEQLGDQGFELSDAAFEHDAVWTDRLGHDRSLPKLPVRSCTDWMYKGSREDQPAKQSQHRNTKHNDAEPNRNQK